MQTHIGIIIIRIGRHRNPRMLKDDCSAPIEPRSHPFHLDRAARRFSLARFAAGWLSIFSKERLVGCASGLVAAGVSSAAGAATQQELEAKVDALSVQV